MLIYWIRGIKSFDNVKKIKMGIGGMLDARYRKMVHLWLKQFPFCMGFIPCKQLNKLRPTPSVPLQGGEILRFFRRKVKAFFQFIKIMESMLVKKMWKTVSTV
jgi:hypothetical protein